MGTRVKRLLLAALAGVALLPVWGGCEAQRAYLELGEELRGALGDQARVVTTFDRGWLRSRAHTRIGPRGEDGPVLELSHAVYHGPLSFGELLHGRMPRPVRAIIDTDWTPDLSALPAFEAALADRPLIRVRTRLLPDGSSRSDIESPPLTSEDGAVRWSGVEGSVLTAPGGGRSQGFVEARELAVKEDGRVLRVAGVAADFEGSDPTETLPRGEFRFGMQELSLSEPAGKGPPGEAAFALRGLRFSEVGKDDVLTGLYQLTLTAGFEELRVGGLRYGPGDFELVLRNLNAQALEALGTQALEEPDDADPEARRAAATRAALAALPALLGSSPELEIPTLRLDGPDGRFDARARVGFAGADPARLSSPLFAMLALEADVGCFVPELLLERLLGAYLASQVASIAALSDAEKAVYTRRKRGELLHALVGADLLRPVADGYRFDLHVSEGELRINGRLSEPGSLALAGLLGGTQAKQR